MRIVAPARASTGRRSASRGGAAIEFALILPLFLAILFGIIDYGWYFYQRYALVAAIRDGVRYGATFSEASAWNNAKSQAVTDLKVTGSPINYLDVTWGP
ncbi:MAG TPA: TadE family protein, partial [Polyangia bacterium]